MSQQISAEEQVLGIVTNHWQAHGVGLAAKLELADHLADGPLAVEELAKRSRTHAPSLYRMLRERLPAPGWLLLRFDEQRQPGVAAVRAFDQQRVHAVRGRHAVDRDVVAGNHGERDRDRAHRKKKIKNRRQEEEPGTTLVGSTSKQILADADLYVGDQLVARGSGSFVRSRVPLSTVESYS